MNQSYQRTRVRYSRLVEQKRLNKRLALFLVAVTALVVGAATNAYDNLRYSNLLSQADSKTSSAQTELGKEEYDLRFLVSNSSNQWNCYNFASSYTRSLCNTHTKT
jgi:hypothetical protein